MGERGRPRKYSPKQLERLAEDYFKTISRLVKVTEQAPTGQRDANGHMIFESKPVKNQLGEEIWATEYLVPPTVAGLCRTLGIDRATWGRYCNGELHPEMAEVTERIRDQLRAWNEEQLLTRPGKDLKGIIFNLENNYGYKERHSVEHSGPGARELSLEEKLTAIREIFGERGE